MMEADELVKILAGLGFGTGVGAAITAIINAQSQKGKSRAEAVELLLSAAERVGKMNASLDADVQRMRASMDAAHAVILKFIDGLITQEELLEQLRALLR